MERQNDLDLDTQGLTSALEIELPWPPSANHYQGYRVQFPKLASMIAQVSSHGWAGFHKWLRSKAFVQSYLTPEAKEYHANVLAVVLKQRVNKGLIRPLKMTCHAFPPDRRKRDLSNLLKMAEDAMQSAGVFLDDNQIAEHHLIREAQTVKFGRLVVTLEELI